MDPTTANYLASQGESARPVLYLLGGLALIGFGYLYFTRPVKVKKLVDRPGFRESPITAAFKYA